MEIILASNNPDKLREVREILAPLGITVLSQAQAGCRFEAEENGTSFTENARIKALAAVAATGKICVADDSGLEVDAMDGGPGIYSSRFCGDRTYKEACRDIMETVDRAGARGARFRCAVVCRFPDGREIACEGVIEGRIGRVYEGEHGFGYDPIFVPEGYGRSMACLTDGEKNAISHRGRAFRRFAEELKRVMEGREQIC